MTSMCELKEKKEKSPFCVPKVILVKQSYDPHTSERNFNNCVEKPEKFK